MPKQARKTRRRPRSKSVKDEALIRHAYHEAGHVVICELLGRRVKSAVIHKNGGLVRTVSVPKMDLRRPPRTLRERWIREREVMCYFAGVIAEEMYTGRRTLDGVGDDFHAIESILGCRWMREEEAIAYGRWLYERTVSLVALHRRELTRAANLLLKRRCLGCTDLCSRCS